jgi:hypothetical protein
VGQHGKFLYRGFAKARKRVPRVLVDARPALQWLLCALFVDGRGVHEMVSRVVTFGERVILPLEAAEDAFSPDLYWWLFRQLIDRIALVQRIRFVGADATAPLAEIASTRRLRLDPESRRVWVGKKEIEPPLSPAQYGLLEFLSSWFVVGKSAVFSTGNLGAELFFLPFVCMVVVSHCRTWRYVLGQCSGDPVFGRAHIPMPRACDLACQQLYPAIVQTLATYGPLVLSFVSPGQVSHDLSDLEDVSAV